MKNLKELSAKFENKGSQFISFPNYETGSGTIYENMVINTNISQMNLNKANLAKVLAFDLSTFDFKSEPKDLETLQTAYDEVLQSAKNSLLPKAKKNNKAKAQKTRYKNLLKQQIGFKTKKTYTLEKIDSVKVQGDTIILK